VTRRRLAVVAAALAVAGAAAFIGWKRTRVEKTMSEREVEHAEALARGYDRKVVVEPYGFSARIGRGWSCAVGKETKRTRCSGGEWSVSWSVEPEKNEASTQALIAEAAFVPNDPPNVDRPGRPLFMTRRELAGFSGYLRHDQNSRESSDGFLFFGWRDDARRGRLRLVATAYARRGADVQNEDGETQVDGLAVLLTTTGYADGAGPSPEWRGFER